MRRGGWEDADRVFSQRPHRTLAGGGSYVDSGFVLGSCENLPRNTLISGKFGNIHGKAMFPCKVSKLIYFLLSITRKESFVFSDHVVSPREIVCPQAKPRPPPTGTRRDRHGGSQYVRSHNGPA